MKRSEINVIMRRADAFLREHRFHLPPFAYWTPEEWAEKGPEVAEIVERRLGWDITDFGKGDFEKVGLFLFTLRNGDPANLESCSGKLYAEKIMIVEEGQVTPLHFHWDKVEDIINRGGGNLMMQFYNATADEELAEGDLSVSVDGVVRTVPAGGVLALTPGESVTLPTRCYHKFWAEEGRTLVGEVSMVNDDATDNRFHEPLGRYPAVEEDEPPLYLLCTDYDGYWSP